MTRTFPSIQHPEKYAYKYDSSPQGYEGTVHCNFRVYETYADALCQHSSDWAIARNLMADYLASLATAMLADADLTDQTSYLIDSGPNPVQIAFAASIIYKESDSSYSKHRYFSIPEQKLSSSATKEHDRRYERVQPWCDGSPDAIYKMLLSTSQTDLNRYACAHSIRDWVLTSARKLYMPLPAEFLKWDDRDNAQQLRHAYSACLAVIRSQRLRNDAITHLQNVRPPQPKLEVPQDPQAETALQLA